MFWRHKYLSTTILLLCLFFTFAYGSRDDKRRGFTRFWAWQSPSPPAGVIFPLTRSIQFNDVDSYYDVGTTACDHDGSQAITFGHWVKPQFTAGFEIWTSKAASSIGSIQGQTAVIGLSLLGSLGGLLRVDGTGAISVTNWQLWVFTYNGAKSPIGTGLKIYIDGAAIATTTLTDTLTGSLTNAAPCVLGSNSPAPSSVPPGNLAFAFFYFDELDATEITELYNGGVTTDLREQSWYNDSLLDFFVVPGNHPDDDENSIKDLSINNRTVTAVNIIASDYKEDAP